MSEWISVESELPYLDPKSPKYAQRARVIVAHGLQVREMVYAINAYAKTEKGRLPRWEEVTGTLAFNEPTHWMPLPAPPTE